MTDELNGKENKPASATTQSQWNTVSTTSGNEHDEQNSLENREPDVTNAERALTPGIHQAKSMDDPKRGAKTRETGLTVPDKETLDEPQKEDLEDNLMVLDKSEIVKKDGNREKACKQQRSDGFIKSDDNLTQPKYMAAEITKREEETSASTIQCHRDVTEVWEAQADTNDEGPTALVELGIEVLMDDWLSMNIDDEESETEIFWDTKSCLEDKDINYQSDVEEEQFWDSLESLEANIETHRETGTEVDHDKRIMNALSENNKGDAIEKGHDIKEAWDNIHMDEDFKSKLNSKNVAWNIICKNKNTVDINDRNNKNKDESEFNTSDKACKLKPSLNGDTAPSNREDPEDINRAKKRRQKKGRLGNTFIPNLIVFSAIICKLALGKTVGGLVENNRIEKGSLTPLLQNGLSEEEVFKRQIDGEIFRAYKCQEESMSTAEFSLNPPPECRTEAGSAYHRPIEKKAQILQRVRRIPVEITTCVVQWRVNVGWCGGEYVALNYMHADIETLRTNILPSNVQCHEADPHDTLTITIPEYGSIEELYLKIQLNGGVGEAAFQPSGYSRPDSYCEGTPFYPPKNTGSSIEYIDFKSHYEKKEQWPTDKIRHAVVTYRLSAKVLKTKAYIVDDGLKMIIPNILSINRSRDQTAEKVLENSSFEYELEGYHDATVGTIVFNRTILPRNRCPDSRWTIISL